MQKGNEHFATRATVLHDDEFEDLRELECRVIDERIRRPKSKQQTGKAVDDDIKVQGWWKDRANELDVKWYIDIPQADNDAAF